MITKSDDWKYEEEYRLIAVAKEAKDVRLAEHLPLKTENNYLAVPQHALRSVIVGCQGNYDAVNALVQKVDPAVTVIRAIRQPGEYRLSII